MSRSLTYTLQRYREGFLTGFLLFAVTGLALAQADKKFVRQGNREYDKSKFSESEISYRRAIDKNKESVDAVFNAGDALYKQKKYEDAGKQFIQNHNMNEEKNKKAASLYNLGNSLLMANKVQESIDAYKGSLKLDPKNMETKYNLAYAQDLLKAQQQQKQKDQNKNDQKKDQQQQPQQQQQQQQQQGISKEDAQRLLNALANDEKNVQEKVKLAKATKAKVRTVKNW
jgi:tetratricopeptide (TPR) repeat protein